MVDQQGPITACNCGSGKNHHSRCTWTINNKLIRVNQASCCRISGGNLRRKKSPEKGWRLREITKISWETGCQEKRSHRAILFKMIMYWPVDACNFYAVRNSGRVLRQLRKKVLTGTVLGMEGENPGSRKKVQCMKWIRQTESQKHLYLSMKSCKLRIVLPLKVIKWWHT